MISTEPSTFEFAQDWLVSSDCLVRDLLGITEVSLDEARDLAKARIHREEVYEQPNEDEEGETAPDTPPPIDSRPLIIIESTSNERRRVGTGTWGGRGSLRIKCEVLVPLEHQINHADDTPTTRAATFKARKTWAAQLWNTIRQELMATSGLSGEGGTPYLNAHVLPVEVEPTDPAEGESGEWMAWIFEVEWN